MNSAPSPTSSEKQWLIAAEKELLRRTLHDYIRAAWHIVEPGTPYVDNWHIGAIAEHLEAVSRGQLRKLLINIPPRHMKSLLVSVFWPTWEWTFNPHCRWMFTSYSSDLTIRDNLKARDIIESPWYQARWGDIFQLKHDQNQKTRYENDKTGYRIATSLGGSITGDGAHRRVVDDPHSAKQAMSDDVRSSQIETFRTSWSNRVIDPKTDSDVVMMQRLHEDDLSGFILAHDLGYEHLMLPTRFDAARRCVTSIGFSDPRSKEGELLNPERFGVDEIKAEEKNLGPYAFAGQHLQDPAPADGGLLKKSWWRFWQHPGLNLPPVRIKTADGWQDIHADLLPKRFDKQATSWDMTFDDTAGADDVAGGVWAALKADRYLLACVSEKMDIVATLEAFEAMAKAHPEARTHYIEQAANGPAVAKLMKREISGIELVHTSEIGHNKAARVIAVQPEIKSGNVYLPHPDMPSTAWVWDFIQQCAQFPKGKRDDMVDQMTLALIKLAGHQHEAAWYFGDN